MTTFEKLLITCLLVWLIVHFAAMPGTKLSEWGYKKFGGHEQLYGVIAFICFFPLVVYTIYYLWAVL